MQADMAWADKADYLIALYGERAVGALLDRIAKAVRLGDDFEVWQLDRLLQHVERRLDQPWRVAGPMVPPRVSEPIRPLMMA